MPYREFFENDKSGAKKRLSYLYKYPDVLQGIEDWTSKHNLGCLSFEERIYHCVNELTKLPVDPVNGLLREYRGPHKGYSVRGKVRIEAERETLQSIKCKVSQYNGGGVTQKILNNSDLLKELLQLYPQENVPLRAKVKLFLDDVTEIPRCENCGKMTSFQPGGLINATCSETCRRAREQRFRSNKFQLGNRMVRVQGYEHFVLQELLKTYLPDDILVSDEIAPIPYGQNKLYHPDIKIISENKIIEVKSSYTYRADLDKNREKRQATLDAGYKFEFHIWDLKQITT
jgi:hypothetical protein